MQQYLIVEILNAKNVRTEKNKKYDPYVIISYKGIEKKTTHKNKETDPVWNEKLEFEIKDLKNSDILEVRLLDSETLRSDRELGTGTVDLSQLIKNNELLNYRIQITGSGGNNLEKTELYLNIKYKNPHNKNEINLKDMAEVYKDSDNIVNNQYDVKNGQSEITNTISTTSDMNNTYLSHLSQDFQIRIKIFEARQLEGNSLHPICYVHCINKVKHTKIRHSTTEPFWNEVFFFNFQSLKNDMMNKNIKFKVYNSVKCRKDSLIGSFEINIGHIYNELNHSIIRKWLLLYNRHDTYSTAKGYLKVTINILGPGDELPSNIDMNEDRDDFENNLLKPAGLSLQPATFVLKIYKAEDLPQMDPALFQKLNKSKELVDPYVVFSFAGLEVQSKTIKNNYNPQWNQELKIGFKFPSMCDTIKILVMDWDLLTHNDVIGTLKIPIQSISDKSEFGFLPCFGPCYVNMYGATREYEEFSKLKSLNSGEGEGVAYRGRLLIELKTILGEYPTEQISDILFAEADVASFHQRKKYKLHACFLDANMICVTDKPIEFEISIGLYGYNSLNTHLKPNSSITSPCNSVYDGNAFYYLPWTDAKPYLQISSYWEDISYRLESANKMKKLRDFVKSFVKEIRNSLKLTGYIIDQNSNEVNNVHDKLNNMIDQNSNELCRLAKWILDKFHELEERIDKNALPEPNSIFRANELDRALFNVRTKNLQELRRKCTELPHKTLKVTIEELDNFVDILTKLAHEPQNCIPDVIIWMLSGNERIGYYKIPVTDIFYSDNSDGMGQFCGEVQSIILKWPGKEKSRTNRHVIPAQLRAKFWFGLVEYEYKWISQHSNEEQNGAIAIFAETYEYQKCKGTSWSPLSFSDVTGKIPLPKDKFTLPSNWMWDGNWTVTPDLSLLFEKDFGFNKYTEKIFEQQSRILPGINWPSPSDDQIHHKWVDNNGEICKGKDEIELSNGWEWDDVGWSIDLNRAVDSEGWEYCFDPLMGQWFPTEATFHLVRRRLWQCNRIRNTKHNNIYQIELEKNTDVWEYAKNISTKFHAKNESEDKIRRKRWRRKMKQEKDNNMDLSALFTIDTKGINSSESNDKNDSNAISLNVPKMFLCFKKSHRFQLRAYILEARSLPSADSDTKLSDPYCQIVCLNQSMKTRVINKTLSPIWDQTLIFEDINIYGDITEISRTPPQLLIEIFDNDIFGKHDFLGRCMAFPKVFLDNQYDKSRARLKWFNLYKNGKEAGEVLAAFELFWISNEMVLPLATLSNVIEIIPVPDGIRPSKQRTVIEIFCLGLRNMKQYQLSEIVSPQIIFECGSAKKETDVLYDFKTNPNFSCTIWFDELMLPKEEAYLPEMRINVVDHRKFGRKPLIGTHLIKNLFSFKRDVFDNFLLKNSQANKNVQKTPYITLTFDENESKTKDIIEEDIDWYSKYYASINKNYSNVDKEYEKLEIFKNELENEKQFDYLLDFCNTFKIYRDINLMEDDDVIGEFKGMVKVYPAGDSFEEIKKRSLENIEKFHKEEYIVRVYVVKGVDLQPKDSNGKSDPYIQIIAGKTLVDDRDNYIPQTNNPEFGRMFELKLVLPMQKDLCIKIKDYDMISSDDLIGETWIDLENRILTKYRATCGLPKNYYQSGPNIWRDSLKPSEILTKICKKHNMRLVLPSKDSNTLTIENKEFNLNNYENDKILSRHAGAKEERLCLHVLNEFKLVPEHIENRKLFNSVQPNIEQGRLQMWIDIFPKSVGNPGPPVDITPRKPKPYVLRCIIYSTKEVPLDDFSITGEKMSDIYVKGWIQGLDTDKQRTDVHYRSLDGDGYFNWRFVFNFDYIAAEQSVSIKKKDHFLKMDATETKQPLVLNIQIWDNDKFSPDDFIGKLSLDINNMKKPVKEYEKCGLDQIVSQKRSKKTNQENVNINLFAQKRVKGWWPCTIENKNEKKMAGKIEMELEILTEAEAMERPAGKGRESPNDNPKLEDPLRPETSFLWFSSPFRTLKYIVWRKYKWDFVFLVLLVITLLFILLMIYTMPSAIWSNVIFRV